MLKRHRLGRDGEDLAAERLARLGFAVLERRFRCRRGDIDIVCQKGETRILVEVKTRSGPAFGTGAEVLSTAQRRTLLAGAAEYRALTGWRGPIGFLLVFVKLGYAGEEPAIELLNDAIA